MLEVLYQIQTIVSFIGYGTWFSTFQCQFLKFFPWKFTISCRHSIWNFHFKKDLFPSAHFLLHHSTMFGLVVCRISFTLQSPWFTKCWSDWKTCLIHTSYRFNIISLLNYDYRDRSKYYFRNRFQCNPIKWARRSQA